MLVWVKLHNRLILGMLNGSNDMLIPFWPLGSCQPTEATMQEHMVSSAAEHPDKTRI